MDSRKRHDTGWRGLLGGWIVMCLLVVEALASEPELSKAVYDQLVQAQELSQQEQHQQALSQLQTLAQEPRDQSLRGGPHPPDPGPCLRRAEPL